MVEGRLEKRQGSMRRATECRVFLPDHHEAYIDWATYEENQRMIRRNSVNWQRDESMPAIRAGQGLLVGLLRCGHCGRKLHVRYWALAGPTRGISAREITTTAGSIAWGLVGRWWTAESGTSCCR